MHRSGLFDQAAAEIVAHDAWTQRLFVVNAASGLIDVLDVRAPARPTFMLNVSLGGAVNSVAAHQGLIAAAVENVNRTAAWRVAFLPPMAGAWLSSSGSSASAASWCTT